MFRKDTKKSVHLSDINNSLIFIYHVDGSILGHRITNSILIAACLQCRIHDTSNSLLSLSIPNHPVIENCKQLVFSSADTDDISVFDNRKSQSEHSQPNMCFDVKDFHWFQRSHSPHWEEGSLQSYVNTHDDVSALFKRLSEVLSSSFW